MTVDFTRHLSREALARRANPMKEIRRLVLEADRPLESFTSLSNGNVHPSLFPVSKLAFEIPDISRPKQIVDNWRLECSPSATLSVGSGHEPSHLDMATAFQYSLGRGTAELVSTLQSLNTQIHPSLSHNTVTLCCGNADGATKLFRLFLNPGDPILLEEFSYPGITNSLTALGARLAPVKMDKYGLIPEEMNKLLLEWNETAQGHRPHVLYLIPCGQNPTGSTLPLERRVEIYKIAQKWDIMIIEDDPYYSLQFSDAKIDIDANGSVGNETLVNGHANGDALTNGHTHGDALTNGHVNGVEQPVRKLLPSLLSMDVEGRVIRIDTFSKTLAPGFRLGWFTSHPFFQVHIERMTDDSVQHPNGFSQIFVAKLLSPAPQGWGFDGYIKWCGKLSEDYSKKRDLLLGELKKALGDDWGKLAWAESPVSGMFIRLYISAEKHTLFKRDENAEGPKTNTREIVDSLFELLLAKGVVIMPGKTFAHARDELDDIYDRCNFFRVTYSESDENLKKGADLIAEGIKEFFKTD